MHQHYMLLLWNCDCGGGGGTGLIFSPVFPFSYIVFLTCSLSLIFLNVSWVSPRPRVLCSSISSACLCGWWPFSGALVQKTSPWKAGLDLPIWSFFSSWHNKAAMSSSFSGKARRSHPKGWKRKRFQLSFN